MSCIPTSFGPQAGNWRPGPGGTNGRYFLLTRQQMDYNWGRDQLREHCIQLQEALFNRFGRCQVNATMEDNFNGDFKHMHAIINVGKFITTNSLKTELGRFEPYADRPSLSDVRQFNKLDLQQVQDYITKEIDPLDPVQYGPYFNDDWEYKGERMLSGTPRTQDFTDFCNSPAGSSVTNEAQENKSSLLFKIKDMVERGEMKSLKDVENWMCSTPQLFENYIRHESMIARTVRIARRRAKQVEFERRVQASQDKGFIQWWQTIANQDDAVGIFQMMYKLIFEVRNPVDDPQSYLLMGSSGSGKSYILSIFDHMGHAGRVSFSTRGVGKFAPCLENDVVVVDDPPLKAWDMSLHSNERESLLQLLSGQSAPVKVHSNVENTFSSPWFVITVQPERFPPPELLSPEIKRRLKVFNITPVLFDSRYPINIKHVKDYLLNAKQSLDQGIIPCPCAYKEPDRGQWCGAGCTLLTSQSEDEEGIGNIEPVCDSTSMNFNIQETHQECSLDHLLACLNEC